MPAATLSAYQLLQELLKLEPSFQEHLTQAMCQQIVAMRFRLVRLLDPSELAQAE